jgi:DNA-binding transcriptional LysR family regulator
MNNIDHWGAALITLKQMEALHWISKLGTFDRAAAKLHTTQSAISKRIQELESTMQIEIFDRSQRGARLTPQGRQLLGLAQEMLAMGERILDLRNADVVPTRTLRFGVTELTALTWLPRMVTSLRANYPDVAVEPEVDLSRDLFNRLLDESIDFIVIPDAFTSPRVTSLRLAEVHNSWMASPDLVKNQQTLTLRQLGTFTVLSQGQNSGTGVYFDRWLESQGVTFERVMTSNSLVALVGLTLAGIGVSYLPLQCFRSLIDDGKLIIVPTKPLLPTVPYVAMYRNDRASRFYEGIARLAQSVSDFTLSFQK